MADWYASSTAYAAVAAFVPSAAYTVGQVVKPTAPALKSQWTFRCTTAGTASTEPSWPTANNSTITTGGATFTNVTGQSTYAWSAAAGDLPTVLGNRVAAGDRVFLSSDHTETQNSTTEYGISGSNSFSLIQVMSVNRAGSVPPAPADLTVGASVTLTGAANSFQWSHSAPLYFYGISFIYTGSFVVAYIFGNSGAKTHVFDACQFYWNTSTGCRMQANAAIGVVWNNTTLRFANAGQNILPGTLFEIIWQNTPSAILGTIPTNLFAPGSGNAYSLTARGVDLSALNTTLTSSAGSGAIKILLDSCRIAPPLVRLGGASSLDSARELVELVNCFDGTNIINERDVPAGTVTTNRSTTLVGGAQDDVGLFSHQLVSSVNLCAFAEPLESFWMDVENTYVGSTRTATVEIVSSSALNNTDISLLLEYQGTAGSSLATLTSTLPTVLTASAALPTSTATWNGAPTTTWNPADCSSNLTLSGGNLTAAINSGFTTGNVRTIASVLSAKFYIEMSCNNTSYSFPGIATAAANLTTSGNGTGTAVVAYGAGNFYVNGSGGLGTMGSVSTGNVIGIAVDMTASPPLIWFRNASTAGQWNGSGTANPATGVGGISLAAAGFGGTTAAYGWGGAFTAPINTNTILNAGGSAFVAPAPAGFAAGMFGATQHLQATFTPQTAGRVRGLVRLGKPSTTVWINPQIIVT